MLIEWYRMPINSHEGNLFKDNPVILETWGILLMDSRHIYPRKTGYMWINLIMLNIARAQKMFDKIGSSKEAINSLLDK